MSLFTIRYKPRDMFELDEQTTLDNMMVSAEGIIADIKAMKKLNVNVLDNQNGIISMDCETTDPQAIIELKKIGFEQE